MSRIEVLEDRRDDNFTVRFRLTATDGRIKEDILNAATQVLVTEERETLNNEDPGYGIDPNVPNYVVKPVEVKTYVAMDDATLLDHLREQWELFEADAPVVSTLSWDGGDAWKP